MLKKYFYISNLFFFYIEFDFYILFSFLGIIKIKNSSIVSFFLKKNTLFFFSINDSVIFFIKSIFLLIDYGYFNKFTLVGIGYRQYYSNNIVIYKLWYNHLVYKILPFDIITFKKNKKRKYFTLFSLNKNKLNKIFHI